MTDSSSMTRTPPTMPEILVSATRYASACMQNCYILARADELPKFQSNLRYNRI